MGLDIDVEVEDVRGLLEDDKFVSSVAKKLLQNEGAVDDLIEGVADALEEAIGSDPDFRSKILANALDDSTFRGQVAGALMEELIDD